MRRLMADLRRRFDQPALAGLLVAVLYGLLLMRVLERRDAAEFVQAGAQFVDTTQAPPNLFTVTASTGYDGQFFYRLALTRSAAPTPPLASHSTTRATTTSASCIPCWRMLCRLAAHPWPSIR